MTDPDGGPFDPATIAAIRERLADLDELARRREAALRTPAAPESRAAADKALPDARFVTIYAGQASAAALDHLLAWRLLAHGRQIPIQAHVTLLRAALESADRCRWHLDASVDSGTRVGRGIAARRDDQVERRKFETSPEGGPRPARRTTGRSAIERLAELDDPEAVSARVAAGVRDVSFAKATAMMAIYGHERWYRLSSALAHGSKEWAFAATRLEPSSEPRLDPKVGSGRFSASEPIALALTIVTTQAFRAAIVDLEAYVAPARPGRDLRPSRPSTRRSSPALTEPSRLAASPASSRPHRDGRPGRIRTLRPHE